MGNTTTKADFELFKKECEKWIDFFQLRSWEVMLVHADDIEPALGWFATNFKGRTAKIGLTVDWQSDNPTKELIRKVAFHEVCELLLVRLTICVSPDATPSLVDDITEQTHAIIRRLEHAVFK